MFIGCVISLSYFYFKKKVQAMATVENPKAIITFFFKFRNKYIVFNFSSYTLIYTKKLIIIGIDFQLLWIWGFIYQPLIQN